MTAEGIAEVMEARLTMTVFKDQTLEEAIEIMEAATNSNPSLRELHDRHLSEAMKRRAIESGFFPDCRMTEDTICRLPVVGPLLSAISILARFV